MTTLVLFIVFAGVVGWIAGLVMRPGASLGILLNIVVGVVGAVIAGWTVSPLVGVPSIAAGVFSLGALVVSLLGALVVLAVANLVYRGKLR